jgi:Fe-S-cluster containining protein
LDTETVKELSQEFLSWLADVLSFYNRVNDLYTKTPPLIMYQDPTNEFECVNCGKCCHFDDHFVWVAASDILEWLKRYGYDRRVGMLLFSLSEVEDPDGYLGLGLLSKQELSNFIEQGKKSRQIPKETIAVYEAFQKLLHGKVKGYDPNDNSCIFYDSDSPKHCSIHDIRPIQCRSYPYDYPIFTKINPKIKKLKNLGIQELTPDNEDDIPFCPPSAFKSSDFKEGVKLNEENLKDAIHDKVNYLVSQETETFMGEDLVEIIAELFHYDILDPTVPNKHFQKVLSKFLNNPDDFASNLRINNI